MASLNHIGVAVSNPEILQRLFAILGFQVEHFEEVLEQGVMTHFIPLPQKSAAIELLEAKDPEGTIAQFLKKKGPGIHHLSFELDQGQLQTVSQVLRTEGYRLVYDQPRQGAQGMKINFIHPASAGGILIELMERC